MLWKKESNKENALYVDMFALIGKDMLNRTNQIVQTWDNESTIKKSNAKALEKRMKGNQQFGKGHWAAAMVMYNESLCFAEQGSDHISLAYANRSSCFLKLGMYDECLVDLKLAKEAAYPEHLMHKLDQRELECLNGIEEGRQKIDDFGLKLSYEPDEKLPSIVKVIKIENDDKGEFCVIAKEDIAAGQTIAVEKAFTTCIYMLHFWRCNICLKKNTNLVPCKRCTVAVFCHGKCQGNFPHEDECGLKLCDKSEQNGFVMESVRSILLAINLFLNVNDLIEFVERTIKSDPKNLPNTLTDTKAKYEAFLKLPITNTTSSTSIVISTQFMFTVFSVYNLLLKIPKINAMFKSQKHRRFLMHLIAHHGEISEGNTLRMRLNSVDPVPDVSDRKDICTHTGLIRRYFNHSCAPNVLWMDRDGHSVFITARPVKQGEQLTILFCDLFLQPKAKRQQVILENKGFICKCSRCDGPSASSVQRQQIKLDPDYTSIMSNFPREYNAAELQSMNDKCISFLNKYGQVTWCNEIGRVVHAYGYILRKRLIGNISIDLEGFLNILLK